MTEINLLTPDDQSGPNRPTDLNNAIKGEFCSSGWRAEAVSKLADQQGESQIAECSRDQAYSQAFKFFHQASIPNLRFAVYKNSEELLILIVDYSYRIFAAHQQITSRDVWEVRLEDDRKLGTLSEVLPIILNEIGIAAGWRQR